MNLVFSTALTIEEKPLRFTQIIEKPLFKLNSNIPQAKQHTVRLFISNNEIGEIGFFIEVSNVFNGSKIGFLLIEEDYSIDYIEGISLQDKLRKISDSIRSGLDEVIFGVVDLFNTEIPKQSKVSDIDSLINYRAIKNILGEH